MNACQALAFWRELHGLGILFEPDNSDAPVAWDTPIPATSRGAVRAQPAAKPGCEILCEPDGTPVTLAMRSRPIGARGLTRISERVLSVNSNSVAVLVQADPMRRMISLYVPAGNFVITTYPTNVLTMSPFTIPNTVPTLVIDETTWGAFVQLQWYIRNSDLSTRTYLVWEESYIDAPEGKTQWPPTMRDQAPTIPWLLAQPLPSSPALATIALPYASPPLLPIAGFRPTQT